MRNVDDLVIPAIVKKFLGVEKNHDRRNYYINTIIHY